MYVISVFTRLRKVKSELLTSGKERKIYVYYYLMVVILLSTQRLLVWHHQESAESLKVHPYNFNAVAIDIYHFKTKSPLQTVGYDPIVSAEEAASFGIEYHLLDEMWPLADFITIHTPLLPHLRGVLAQS